MTEQQLSHYPHAGDLFFQELDALGRLANFEFS